MTLSGTQQSLSGIWEKSEVVRKLNKKSEVVRKCNKKSEVFRKLNKKSKFSVSLSTNGQERRLAITDDEAAMSNYGLGG